jgi:NAD(P)-dependent dehydrogenase (short-subunit alcohol dehydrogenase family)
LTKELAIELAPFSIRVNCINPGPADTPLLHSMHNDERIKALSSSMPLIGRLITPEDVASVALFLASDEAITLSGECINVNGGRAV